MMKGTPDQLQLFIQVQIIYRLNGYLKDMNIRNITTLSAIVMD